MGRLYFLGGETVARRDSKEVNALAFEDAGGSPRVLVFPWARASFDASYLRRKRVTEYFRGLGAREVRFADFSDSTEQLSTEIKASELVYLTGGQVSALASRGKAKGLDWLLREYDGVVVGRSAGAVIMGRQCLVTNRYSGRRKVVPGFCLVPFSVKAHYLPAKEALLRRFSLKEKVFAIPHGCALICDRETSALTAVGEVSLPRLVAL